MITKNILINNSIQPWRVIAFLISLCLFITILLCYINGKIDFFDDPIRFEFYKMHNTRLTHILIPLTHMSNVFFIISICVILLIIPKTRFKLGIPLSSGALISTLINKSIKHIILRPRPSDITHLVYESGYSFPSGHSNNSMFFYGLLIYLVIRNIQNPRLKNTLVVILLLPTFGIGLTRIYLGVHYPSDVLAGWCIGFMVLLIETSILDIFVYKKNVCRKNNSNPSP